ncbi:MAG: hypothetical protein WAK35_15595, partial [Xanthobacteraceae bacterium]
GLARVDLQEWSCEYQTTFERAFCSGARQKYAMERNAVEMIGAAATYRRESIFRMLFDSAHSDMSSDLARPLFNISKAL